jgi:drug/metabolite transporter (DMT)-like permease
VGPALCLFSAACFGAMAIFGKLAYAAGVSPGALLLLRFTVAAVLLGLLLALRPGLRTSPPASARPARTSRVRLLVTALGLGALGYATQATFYFSALQRVDASLVALVLYTYPALVTVAAAALGRERLTAGRSAALVVASGGTLLVLLGAGGFRVDRIGVALAFGAAVTYTVYILVADTVVHRLSPVVLGALVMTGASAALAVRAIATGGVELGFGSAGWVWIACIAVVSTVLAMLAFFAGLRRTGPSAAAILSTFEPVVTTALAALTLKEFLTPVQLAGGLIVLSSVGVLQLRPRRRPIGRQPGRPAQPSRRRSPSSAATWSAAAALAGESSSSRRKLWMRPGSRRHSTSTPASASRRAYASPSSRSGSNSAVTSSAGGSPVRSGACSGLTPGSGQRASSGTQ